MSDDAQFGLCAIAFVGSVFSPYYAWARRRGAADPNNYCALNIALYQRGKKRWCMTERSARQVQRSASSFTLGSSQLSWDGSALNICVDEVAAPIPHKMRGQIRLEPLQLFDFSVPLDPQQQHRWGPIAAAARLQLKFDNPPCHWQGSAYLDSNEGDVPIENGFSFWDWSRSRLANGSTAVLYDMRYKNQEQASLSLLFDGQGGVHEFEPPPRTKLPATAWGLARGVRSDAPALVHEQLEDTPFYQRAILKSELMGQTVYSFHESLSVARLVSPLVRAMLPWRMPRRFAFI